MKVEQTKCPNCGASIEYNINLKKQQITCNYCGTNFYVDAITNVARFLNTIDDHNERNQKIANEQLVAQTEFFERNKWFFILIFGFLLFIILISSLILIF